MVFCYLEEILNVQWVSGSVFDQKIIYYNEVDFNRCFNLKLRKMVFCGVILLSD